MVLEHYNVFMSFVETLNQTKPYPSDICTLYYGCWHDDLKRFAKDENYTLPERPLGESNATAWAWLQLVWDAAYRFEQKLALLKTDQPTANGSSSSHQALATFLSFQAAAGGAEMKAMDPKTFQDLDSASQAAFLEVAQTKHMPPVT